MATPRKIPAGLVVLDASFLIDVVRRSKDVERFVPVLKRAEVTSVNFGEVLYKLGRTSTVKQSVIENALVTTGLTVVDVGLPTVRRFLELKNIDAKSTTVQERSGSGPAKTLSLGDLICLGYAMERERPVLTGDRHWTTLGRHGLTVPVFDYRDPDTGI